MACGLPLAAWVHVFRRERRVASEDSREILNFAGVDLNGTGSRLHEVEFIVQNGVGCHEAGGSYQGKHVSPAPWLFG